MTQISPGEEYSARLLFRSFKVFKNGRNHTIKPAKLNVVVVELNI